VAASIDGGKTHDGDAAESARPNEAAAHTCDAPPESSRMRPRTPPQPAAERLPARAAPEWFWPGLPGLAWVPRVLLRHSNWRSA
jgi:hypothetical protein